MNDIAHLDFDRFARRGYAEAVFCLGKTATQCGEIARMWRERAAADTDPLGAVLFTRATAEQAAAVLAELPDAAHDQTSSLLAWPAQPPTPTGGRVVVVCAGTSDLPVAREAALTSRYLGRDTVENVDVGVAGLHRILGRLDDLREADVIVLAAGMDAALV
ncbi:MAG TPA: 1-(5-phosphoribosyl)-5-amino-4-imidazole-carboxylate carboxylase, partial [Arachnia sp.]|nr:1-(5-phosphoribosyl)-5-amino-4-imidazole-carboxylate carboxylase [Arachnia sp.]